jgi:hypothetical protein
MALVALLNLAAVKIDQMKVEELVNFLDNVLNIPANKCFNRFEALIPTCMT